MLKRRLGVVNAKQVGTIIGGKQRELGVVKVV